jgi:ribonuclease HII
MIQTDKNPSFKFELLYWEKGYKQIVGVDEVGRGAFAGPLVAAAVSFDKEFDWFKDIKDSKLLSPQKREILSDLILQNGNCFIEIINVNQINKLGVGKCNKLIFEKLINSIIINHKSKIYFLIDGNKLGIQNDNLKFIVNGDQKVISIAAASIIAKVYRDNLMQELHKQFPKYGFNENKGYGTKQHRNALKTHGLCQIHRTSFNLSKFT